MESTYVRALWDELCVTTLRSAAEARGLSPGAVRKRLGRLMADPLTLNRAPIAISVEGSADIIRFYASDLLDLWFDNGYDMLQVRPALRVAIESRIGEVEAEVRPASLRAIARILHVSQGAATQWRDERRANGFPAPLAVEARHTASQMIFALPEVLAWHRAKESR